MPPSPPPVGNWEVPRRQETAAKYEGVVIVTQTEKEKPSEETVEAETEKEKEEQVNLKGFEYFMTARPRRPSADYDDDETRWQRGL